MISVAAGDSTAKGYVFVFDQDTSAVKKTSIEAGGVRDSKRGVSIIHAETRDEYNNLDIIRQLNRNLINKPVAED